MAEPAPDVAFAELRQEGRREKWNANLASMCVSCKHEVGSVSGDLRKDVGFVREDNDRFPVATSAVRNGMLRIRISRACTAQPDQPNPLSAAFERHGPVSQYR